MLAQAVIAEADAFVAWNDLKLPDGRDRVVRHGHGPRRVIQTRVGPIEVRRAKVRDRGDVGADGKIRFTSLILPKWARRTMTKSLDALLPVLYLVGSRPATFRRRLPRYHHNSPQSIGISDIAPNVVGATGSTG
jgi:putative transposase